MKLALSCAFFAIALVQMTAAAPVVDNSLEQNLESRLIRLYLFDPESDEVVEKRAEQNLEARSQPYDFAEDS
ncbi:uncharacterized protein EDB91DRAFT_509838 [Suillus paluster]|uniref:uncharacterized protein n=1 Tax=Suillus paluster TaxID=48578 RepID=UPI001B861AAF|nr:uncharacterized protein EDB91DRAFT_509838 [Suillus paluster]KAG1752303.1 hypothetical protein EDB91DRAFT_509838 [Suillus paluster]